MLKTFLLSLIVMSSSAFASSKKASPMTFESKHVSVSINHTVEEVYGFASQPENLPIWAEGLSGSISKLGEDWIANSPMGKVKVKFAHKNSFGVLDHDVTLPSGEVVHNPMRVLKNNSGSEVVFTLYRRPQVSDEDFEKDATQVKKDLTKLKSLFEK